MKRNLIQGFLITRNKDNYKGGPNIISSIFIHYLKTKLGTTCGNYGL